MNIQELIDEIVGEVSYRTGNGLVDFQNREHVYILSEVLTEMGLGGVKDELIQSLTEADKKPKEKFKNPILNKVIKYIGNDKKEKEGTVGALLRLKDDQPGWKAADEYVKNLSAEERDSINKELGSQNQPGRDIDAEREKGDDAGGDEPKEEPQQNVSGTAAFSHAPDIQMKTKGDTLSADTIKSELDEIQTNLQQRRDSGDAGAGGAVASQGESRYCNALNTLNLDNFLSENSEDIDDIIEEMKKRKDKYPNSEEWEIIRLLGYGDTPTDDFVFKYLAARELFAKKELERIKQNKESVFYNKRGFSENDKLYIDWMKTAFDGSISTWNILEEDTILDMSKPFTAIQSQSEVDNKVEDIFTKLLQKAKDENNQYDVEFYTNEINNFNKFRTYHDTYVVGQDKNGRTTVVSITNKKDSGLKDPHNNTTPAKRFQTIMGEFGKNVAERVVDSIKDAIDLVSDANLTSIKSMNRIDIDNSMVLICETDELSEYMKAISKNKQLSKYADSKGKNINYMTTKEKLELMKEHSQLLFDSGKKPPFIPYGKIAIKIGEFAQKSKFKKKYSHINLESPSITSCISIKESEKDIVSSTYKMVVDDIRKADEDMGYPKDGINGPHTQAYISTVMEAMHYDTYIDGGDGRIIAQMGIVGAQPKHIRNCLATQSGYTGDVTTTEGRSGLRKHLREKCTVDAKSGAIIVSDGTGTKSICEDTWRTAGTSQKVASAFGEDMRKCIKKAVKQKLSKN